MSAQKTPEQLNVCHRTMILGTPNRPVGRAVIGGIEYLERFGFLNWVYDEFGGWDAVHLAAKLIDRDECRNVMAKRPHGLSNMAELLPLTMCGSIAATLGMVESPQIDTAPLRLCEVEGGQ
jgi:hypothetical protein